MPEMTGRCPRVPSMSYTVMGRPTNSHQHTKEYGHNHNYFRIHRISHPQQQIKVRRRNNTTSTTHYRRTPRLRHACVYPERPATGMCGRNCNRRSVCSRQLASSNRGASIDALPSPTTPIRLAFERRSRARGRITPWLRRALYFSYPVFAFLSSLFFSSPLVILETHHLPAVGK